MQGKFWQKIAVAADFPKIDRKLKFGGKIITHGKDFSVFEDRRPDWSFR